MQGNTHMDNSTQNKALHRAVASFIVGMVIATFVGVMAFMFGRTFIGPLNILMCIFATTMIYCRLQFSKITCKECNLRNVHLKKFRLVCEDCGVRIL